MNLFHIKSMIVAIESNLTTIKSAIEKSIETENAAGQLDVARLIADEDYRVEIALRTTKTREEAAKLLGMSTRTLYRKIYELQNTSK